MLREVEQLRFTNLKYSYLIYFNGIAETIFEYSVFSSIKRKFKINSRKIFSDNDTFVVNCN